MVKCPDDRKEVKVGSKPAEDGTVDTGGTQQDAFESGSGRGGGEWWEGGGGSERRRGRGG